jgi:DNA-binding IclR family transcriptional regulator
MNRVKSAVRVLEVLEQFGDARQPLRLKDIASKLQYPVSSTAALLKSLAECGYLSFDRISRHYYPTNKLPELGSRLASAAVEENVLMEAMHALLRATGELIVVGTPNDIYLDYIKALRSTQAVQLYTPAGTRRLMVQSGMGWLLLSRMERMSALRIYRRTIVAGELRTSDFSERQLVERLQKLRDNDYVLTRSSDYVKTTAHIGGAIMAMLVPTPPNHRALVLGVGGPADRLEKNREKIAKHMRAEMERVADFVDGQRFPDGEERHRGKGNVVLAASRKAASALHRARTAK